MSKIRKCVGKENLQRLNYLYQIGTLYAKSDNKQSNFLSMYYTNLMISVSKKTVQRIEPNVKRKICKVCKNLFIPGRNCKVRIRKNKVQYTCHICSSTKAYTTQETYLWLDQPESINETLDYSRNKKNEDPKYLILTQFNPGHAQRTCCGAFLSLTTGPTDWICYYAYDVGTFVKAASCQEAHCLRNLVPTHSQQLIRSDI